MKRPRESRYTPAIGLREARRRTAACRDIAGGSDPRKSEDEVVDRLSGLPDSLLLHILSFLPIRCAVRTSLMLTPFHGLWRSLRTLSIEEWDFHNCYARDPVAGDGGFSNFVNEIVVQHESCEIDRFRIDFDFYAIGFSSPDSYVYDSEVANRLDKWICFALKKKVKALDVSLMCMALPSLPYYHKMMPSAFLKNNNNLVELSLCSCNIESLVQIQLTSLLKLSLCKVIVSDDVMRSFILGSRSLKKVSLENCHGLQVLKMDNHPSVEELKVCLCHGLKEIDVARSVVKILAVQFDYSMRKINCPNVEILELDGSISGVIIACGSSVSDMALYIRSDFTGEFEQYPEVRKLLEKVHNAAHTILCNWSIFVFSIWKLTNQPRPSFNWRSVETTLNLSKWHLPGISYMLESCNFLETLTIYIYRPVRYEIWEKDWKQNNNIKPGLSYWDSVEGTFHCLKHHLKTVMIYARVTEPYVTKLIQFLLGNALVLENMVISAKKNTGITRNKASHYQDIALGDEKKFTSKTLVKFSKKVLSFPRVSPNAVVQIV